MIVGCKEGHCAWTCNADLPQLVCIASGKHDLIGCLCGDVHDALLVDHRQDAPDVPDVALASHHRFSALLKACLCPDTYHMPQVTRSENVFTASGCGTLALKGVKERDLSSNACAIVRAEG